MNAPRLVVFDIDGTLQDTRAWWPRLCNAARVEFAASRGAARPAPMSDAACDALIGRGELWDALLPLDDVADGERVAATRAFAELAIEREVELLTSGADTLFEGVREMLAELHASGARVALASNCGGRYLEAFVDGQGLDAWIDSARCLEGVRPRGAPFRAERVPDKVATLGRVLADFAARPEDVVMVGDRASDAEAARAHGVRFVLRCDWHEPGALGEDVAVRSTTEMREALAAR